MFTSQFIVPALNPRQKMCQNGKPTKICLGKPSDEPLEEEHSNENASLPAVKKVGLN